MSKYMSDEEFSNCSSIDNREIYYISEELRNKGIKDIAKRIEYVKENYGGKEYLYFMLKELDDKMLKNYNKVPEEYLFSKSAIDGLLRSYLFVSKYMQDKLPEHAYNYIKGKSNNFVNELETQLK